MNSRRLAVCVLTTKAAVLEHDLATVDIIAEPAKGEPPLAFSEGEAKGVDERNDSQASSRISVSACSSQNRMSISRYSVVPMMRCS